MDAAEPKHALASSASGPWTDLGLTLPVFLAYHLGVVWLPVRNAADWLTLKLVGLADHDLALYGLLTVSIGAVYVGILVVAGRGRQLRPSAFAWLMIEAIAYAVAMRTAAGYVVGQLPLSGTAAASGSVWSAIVLSCGAGFYEEVAFRVAGYGLGLQAIKVLFPLRRWQLGFVALAWAVVMAGLFSLWHYLGPFGDALDLRTFVFRWVCGLIFTVIYVFRGFAPAVWTHALYDVWVLVPASV